MLNLRQRCSDARRGPFYRLFIGAMIRHHEQAVEAAVLAQTERAEVRGLAQDSIEAQTREIEQMREWRGTWY